MYVCSRVFQKNRDPSNCVLCAKKNIHNSLVFRWISFYELIAMAKSQQLIPQKSNWILYVANIGIKHIHEYWHIHEFVWWINVFATAYSTGLIYLDTCCTAKYATWYLSHWWFMNLCQKTPIKKRQRNKKTTKTHTGMMNSWTATNWPLI